MTPTRIETVVESDGELHLANLPYQKGDRVAAVITLRDDANENVRLAARQRFLDRARLSKFRSTGSYPRRDELHERD
jgi:hypothetical protein